MAGSKLRVAFVHPDLGIGGAERLVVDAAVGLQNIGHTVEVYTAHCSPTHSFSETQDGTLKVHVYGDFLPNTLFGRFRAVFAYLRVLYVSLRLLLSSSKYDIIFVDQVSASIPILRLSGKAKIVFYCHFPDKMLTTRTSLLKQIYRYPIDWLEETTTGMADKVLVNSCFTQEIFGQSFKRLTVVPEVLYPAINFSSLAEDEHSSELALDELEDKTYFLSINRFERKKAIELALIGFAKLVNQTEDTDNLHIVLAGGYDPNLPENNEVVEYLQSISKREGIDKKVSFVKSFSETMKKSLLYNSYAVLYTPSNEHFGIVPLEAMFCSKPVIAVNSGGPRETVKHMESGLLCNPTPEDFCSAMKFLLDNPLKVQKMGLYGKETVEKQFGLENFAHTLDGVITQLL